MADVQYEVAEANVVEGAVKAPAAAHSGEILHDGDAIAAESETVEGNQAVALDPHAEEAAHTESHPPELPNATWFFYEYMAGREEGQTDHTAAYKLAKTLHKGNADQQLPIFNRLPWENHLWIALAALILFVLFLKGTKQFRTNRAEAFRRPGRGQILMEMIVGGFDSFCKGILGEHNGRQYMPYIGSVFMLVLVANLFGIIPFFKAPTSAWIITLGLALCTFIYVQFTGLTRLGPAKYLHHLMGSPSGIVWALAPLFFVIECISEFVAKPLSLSLRLFGNILGKDILLGSFVMLGMGLLGALLWPAVGQWFGIPLHFPFLFLAIILSAIQALVFALLSCIYLLMMLPHDEDHH